jgi:hypothetical protein
MVWTPPDNKLSTMKVLPRARDRRSESTTRTDEIIWIENSADVFVGGLRPFRAWVRRPRTATSETKIVSRSHRLVNRVVGSIFCANAAMDRAISHLFAT